MKNCSKNTCSKFFDITNNSHVMGNVCNTNKALNINFMYLWEASRPVDMTRSQNNKDLAMQKAVGYPDLKGAMALKVEKIAETKIKPRWPLQRIKKVLRWFNTFFRVLSNI